MYRNVFVIYCRLTGQKIMINIKYHSRNSSFIKLHLLLLDLLAIYRITSRGFPNSVRSIFTYLNIVYLIERHPVVNRILSL